MNGRNRRSQSGITGRGGAQALSPCRAVAALAWVLSGVACVHGKGTAEHPAVVDLRIEGADQLNQDELKKKLATQQSKGSLAIPIIGPLVDAARGAQKRKVPLVDPSQLAVDRQRVEAYARDRGYFDAAAAEPEVVRVGEGQAEVVLRLDEGEPARVTRIELDGLDDAPAARKALTRPALQVGDVFTVAAYDTLRDQLLAALQNSGWATAEVAQEAQVFPAEHAAVVRYTIKAGRRYRFGPVRVTGTSGISGERVGEEVAGEIREGEPYDERKLVLAQARVFALGVFETAQVSRGAPDEAAGIMPITVTVREGAFHRVRLGPSLGVSVPDRVDVTALVGWTNRRFLGDLRTLDLSASVGYAWLLTPPENQGWEGTVAADFTQPALWRNVDLNLHLELQRARQQGYNYWAQIARLAFPIRLSRRVRFSPSYNIQVYELSDTVDTLDPNDPNSTNKLLQSCPDTTCLINYLQQKLEYDDRDDPINTRKGLYLALTVQEGWRLGGYGYQFAQVVPEARAYFPVGEVSVLAVRARLGAFIPVKESELPPTVALFFAGGANSMRGYGQERLSPMLCAKTENPETKAEQCNGEWVPEGGNGLAEYSVEFRFPISGSLWGVVFTDAGYVSRRSAEPTAYLDALHLRNLQLAAGFGVRFRTPVGPIRFDVGARLPTDLSAGVEFDDRFPPVPPSSQVPDPGPHREPIVVGHFSIGEAF